MFVRFGGKAEISGQLTYVAADSMGLLSFKCFWWAP